MQYIILSILMFFTLSMESQQKEFTYNNFEEEVLAYEPVQRKNVTTKNFKMGLIKLNDVKLSVKNNVSNFTDADFWKITMALLNFNEPKPHIEIAFKKAINFKDTNICSYIDAMGPSGLDKVIPELFNGFYNNCKNKTLVKPILDLRAYSKKEGFNFNLVELINKVKIRDFYYRKEKGKYYDDSKKLLKQKNLDSKNQRTIDSLHNIYKTYIGKSLVGEKFASVMWNVIQHSNVEMMGKYLPSIQKACIEKQLDVASLKMLIDRYYGLKYGYQVFGSQSGFGFKMANPKKREEIIKKYGIE